MMNAVLDVFASPERQRLHAVAVDGSLHVVCTLLQKGGVDIDAREYSSGRSALILASEKGHLDIVCALLNPEHNNVATDVNLQDHGGRTALSWASDNGHFDIVCALLNHNAIDVIRRDHGGRIALDMSSIGKGMTTFPRGSTRPKTND
jgi:ankyrin repeat protein